MTEFRNSPDLGFQTSVRADDGVQGLVEIDVVPYNVVDAYKTRWMPGVFNESIEKRSPPICFGHSWLDPIGHMVDKDDNPVRLHALYQLDNFDDVPRARQVYSQIRSKTLTDTSFGFERVADGEDEPDKDGVINFRKSTLQEVSPVLIGAVPGAGPTGIRQLPAAEVLRLAGELERQEISLDDALTAVTRIAMESETRAYHSHARQAGGGIMNHSHTQDAGMHAHSGLMPAVRLGRAAPAEDAAKHTHAMAGGGSFTHTHPIPDSGSHSHAEDAKGNSSGAQLLPFTPGGRAAEPEETRIDGVPNDGSAGVGPSDTADACPKCGANNNRDAQFCDQCGASMQRSLLIDEARELLDSIAER